MNLTIEPTFQQVTWVVGDFFKLPQKRKFFLDSPEFFFHDDRYGIRLYPKGKRDRTAFHLRRLSVKFPENKVSSKIGLRTREPSGDESYNYDPWSFKQNCSSKRSRIEEDRDALVPDGSLSVACCMRLSKWGTAGSSAQGEEEQGGFPGDNPSFSSGRSPAKTELTTQSPCTLVRLSVPKVFELLSETGNSRTSPEFRFGGDSYCFRFEANENRTDTELQLVRLTSNFTENTVYYRVGYGRSTFPVYPNNSRSLVGNVGFCVSRSELEEVGNKYVHNGDLNLLLFLRLGQESSAGAGTSNAAQKRSRLTGLHKLQSDYRQLLQEDTVSDACLIVRGKEFKVHRVVLSARSSVFAAMFTHDMTEKKSGRVVIDDLDPESFGVFLEYLYTGDVQDKLSDDNAFGLYVAADKYDVSTLKSQCLELMRRTLSVDSFCDVVTLALRHSEEELLKQSIHFLRDNFQRIIITAQWQQFNIENAATANELFNKAFLPGTPQVHFPEAHVNTRVKSPSCPEHSETSLYHSQLVDHYVRFHSSLLFNQVLSRSEFFDALTIMPWP